MDHFGEERHNIWLILNLIIFQIEPKNLTQIQQCLAFIRRFYEIGTQIQICQIVK